MFLNGAAIAWKARRQTTVSLDSTEAEVKAMVPGVQMVRALTGIWGEFMRQQHGCVRVLDDSQGGISQVVNGMDTKKCASYKKAQFYAEDAVCQGMMWLDLVSGRQNPADILTKQPGNIAEFEYKNGVMCGSVAHLNETVEVLKILDAAKRK